MIEHFEKNEIETNLLCPITGERLIWIGSDVHVMDPDSFYKPTNTPNIIYARHPFSYNLFRLVENSYNHCQPGKKFFRLNEDNSWTEMILIKEIDKLVEIDTNQEEIDKLISKILEEKRKKKEDYDEKVRNGQITPITIDIKKVEAQQIGLDLVEVKPLSPPSSIIFFNK
jgi:hypothetical protein